MKRVKTLAIGNGVLSANVKITFVSNDYLTKAELDKNLDKLTDKVMIALSEVPYSQFYLSKVKVK